MKLANQVLEILAAVGLLPIAWILRLIGSSPARVLVAGWWGSETVGDVAILGQLLAELSEVVPGAKIAVASFRPVVTEETLRELGREDVALVPVGIRSGWAVVSSRCLLFGGGPLMDSNSMPFWALRTWAARLAGARVMLYACGIGPVRWRRTRLAVSVLLHGTTQVVLRDEANCRSFEPLLQRKGAIVSFDPAYHYVAGLKGSDASRAPRQLALVLRFPIRPYVDREEEGAVAENLLAVVSAALNSVSKSEPELRLVGLVMHTGYVESDDHQLYARLRERLDHPEWLRVAPGRHSVTHVVRGLASSTAALSVRFHGMVFALATGTPFVAIDYSGPSGKVRAAAKLAGVERRVLAWEDLEGTILAQTLLGALSESATVPSPDLAVTRQRRLEALQRACGY